MSFLLRLIPEPYATLLLGVALAAAYLYGDITGKGSERLKNQVNLLTAQNKVLTNDLANASRVQSAMAQEASDALAEVELLKGRGAGIEQSLKTSKGPCSFTDAERLRIERELPIRRKAHPKT